MLLTLDQVLTAEELAQARAWLAASPWESGLATAGPQAAAVKRNRQLPETAPHLPGLRQLVLDALLRNPLFFAAALPARILPPFFNRHGVGEEYGWHVDNAVRQSAQGERVRADVSVTVYLSDPESYEGGELCIQDRFGMHQVKLAAGSAVVYPSSSVHRVSPVTRGERLACFLFMQSLVRDAERRRNLFELDMALIDLRQRLGEADAAVLRLTGVYHNLLRQWAET